MKKKFELLFPELTNIYGENYNAEYIGRCNKDLEITKTNHRDIPTFVNEDVDMIYLGCSPELKQEMIIKALMPHVDRIKELIDKGTIFLVTGNAIEIFGKEIRDGERVIPALGIWNFYSVRYMNTERHNSQYVGTFTTEEGEELTMLGHRSQFSFAYGDFGNFDSWLDINIGIGMNPDTRKEGIHKNRFFATYSLGPCFIMNPLFCKYLLRLMGLDDTLAFEKEAVAAYEYRKNELIEKLGGK